MASVSSLDKDLSRMRLAKYTPQDSQEIKDWIGDTLGEKLPASDLMVVLKDGVVLCKWVFRLPFPLLSHNTKRLSLSRGRE